MTDEARDPTINPILFSTEKEYAWNAFQTAFDPGKLLPDRAYFEAWWTECGLTVRWANIREMMQGAWGSGVQCRNIACTAGFNAWWQEIVDKQPVISESKPLEDSPRVHTNGTPCTCDPRCNCHPPTRKDDTAEAIYERGSFHLKTCPAKP